RRINYRDAEDPEKKSSSRFRLLRALCVSVVRFRGGQASRGWTTQNNLRKAIKINIILVARQPAFNREAASSNFNPRKNHHQEGFPPKPHKFSTPTRLIRYTGSSG